MDVPSGYIFRNLPKSAKEALTRVSTSRIKTVTKGALQNYIKSFFDTTGVNRAILESVGTPIQFFSDLTFKEDGSDPTKRHLQIARFMQEVKEKLPCILIIDGGMRYTPTSFSLIENARMTGTRETGGVWQGFYPVLRVLSLTLLVATNDQDSTDQLHSMLTWMLGELRVLAGGSRITGQTGSGETWVVTLPQTFSPGSVTGEAITGDPKDQLWRGDISLDVTFEDKISIEQDWKGAIESEHTVPKINQPNLDNAVPPSILVGDTIPVNQVTPFVIQNFSPDSHQVILDNPRICTLDLTDMTLHPRSPGEFKIQVISKHRRGTPREGLPPVIVAQKLVSVVF